MRHARFTKQKIDGNNSRPVGLRSRQRRTSQHMYRRERNTVSYNLENYFNILHFVALFAYEMRHIVTDERLPNGQHDKAVLTLV